MARVFILSPARCSGRRADLVYNEGARFELALKLRTPRGATIGETFSFLSGLYFRGKVTYARAFAAPPAGLEHAYIITTNRGLVGPDELITLSDLRAMGGCDIDVEDARYRRPLERDLRAMLKRASEETQFVLLGSVASKKYVEILLGVLGGRLFFPEAFVGRGDMSRGGLLLRHAESGEALKCIAVEGAVRRGARPPKLKPR